MRITMCNLREGNKNMWIFCVCFPARPHLPRKGCRKRERKQWTREGELMMTLVDGPHGECEELTAPPHSPPPKKS